MFRFAQYDRIAIYCNTCENPINNPIVRYG